MIPANKLLMKIDKVRLVDTKRCSTGRKPGSFDSIRNLYPTTDGIGRVRPGYSVYDGNNQGITPPTGMEITKIVPIQNPSNEDVHFFFCSDGGSKIYMNPHWREGSKYATSGLLNETQSFTGSAGTVALKTIAFTGSDALGLSSVQDFYNCWIMQNATKGTWAYIWDYVYSATAAGTSIFYFIEEVAPDGLNWLYTEHYHLYRYFHDFYPDNKVNYSMSYSNTLADPPVVNVENSIIRLSGGCGSATYAGPLWINPHLKRSFFPSTHSATPLLDGNFAFEGTYISNRKLNTWTKGYLTLNGLITEGVSRSTSEGLAPGYTYWIAIAPIYDGYQIGPLTKYESPTDYLLWNSNVWYNVNAVFSNYLLPSFVDGGIALTPQFTIQGGLIDKRITGFLIYMAQDTGNTTATGRVNPYHEVEYVSVCENSGHGAEWTFDGRYHKVTVIVDGTSWTNKGEVYETSAGYSESPPDTMYNFSTEAFISGRRYIANCYVSSESAYDRQSLFTNPNGGSSIIFNNMPQPDIFPNQEAIYRLRVEPTIGSKINGIISTGIGQFLVAKDSGIILCQDSTIDNIPVLNMRVESKNVGIATYGAWAKDSSGYIYLPSYQNIYRYKNGVMESILESQDMQDWLDTYKNISTTDKENLIAFYLHEIDGVIFLFGTQQSTFNGLQYVYFPDYGWREIRFADSNGTATKTFKWITQLTNTHTLGVTTDATPVIKRFTWKYVTNAFVLTYLDDSSDIYPYFDTGYLILSGSEGVDTILNEIVVNKNQDYVLGTPNIILYSTSANSITVSPSAGKTRIKLRSTPSFKRMSNSFRFLYNYYIAQGARERLENDTTVGSFLQISSLEYFGRFVPRLNKLAD